MTITICGSIQFIEQMKNVASVLTAQGHRVLLPESAEHNQDKQYWQALFEHDRETFCRLKQERMLGHMKKIDDADAALVLNYEKHGVSGYIGPNTLMEIGHAFATQKKLYILNDFNEASPFFEELISLPFIFLRGEITNIV